jgi:alpha-L-fucosidase 2
VFGCRGLLPDLCQAWRHGRALMLYPWAGGAGWLLSYLYDHYRYTGDRDFLRTRLLPLMQEAARFYEDFLEGTEGTDGRLRLYPSVSPENFPIMTDTDQSAFVVPNATCDIAICREALQNVIEACRELDIDSEEVARWRALLERLPDYVVNADGALAEWAYPGMGDRYNHRHSSHLYPLWPSLEISPEHNPDLFRAARRAVDKRLEAGLGNKSSHGYMHLGLVAARLRDAGLLWQLLDDYARQRFFNSSMITCHNPGLLIYNLDGTFTLPSILTKMLLHSERDRLLLLPALPGTRLASGTVRGLRARGGVTVEELHWNMLTGRIVIQLLTNRPQRLALDCSRPLRSVQPTEGSHDDLDLQGGDRSEWTLTLPAGRSVRLVCSV